MPRLEDILTAIPFICALGSGLMGGVFFAFSSFVMKALGRLPSESGVAAMQAINVAVINPLFMGVFLGTAVLCAGAMGVAVWRWERPGAGYIIAGGALYLVGTLGVTIAFNVPLNNSLAALAPLDPDAARIWAGYIARWTAWNHVRTAAAVAAAASFVLGFRQ